jgi:predicted GTPase
MTTAQSLIATSLEETVDIEGHLSFLEELLKRHEPESGRREQWSSALEKIKARREDQSLYLAVAGEFSSGKSTLVNALIGTSWFPADSPATTAAATVVRYGPKPRLRVEYKDGRVEQLEKKDSLREQVRRLTSVEEVARTVVLVTLDDPAPVLEQGLAIVDMPGANTDNVRRTEIVKRALHEFGDAVLVTAPADIPVSDTLVALLRAELGGSLHRCLFVVTKIDCVKPKDRPRLLETIAGRLESKLDVAAPVVLPVSAVAALGEPLPDGTDAAAAGFSGDDYRDLGLQFAAARERMVRTLTAHRPVLLLDRLAVLVSEAFDAFAADLEALAEHARAVRETEGGEALRDFGTRIEAGRQHHGTALAARLDTTAAEARGALAAVRQESLVRIHDLIAKARGGEGLRAAVAQSAVVLEAMEGQLASRLGAICVQIDAAAREEAAAFEADLPAYAGVPAPTPERGTHARATAQDLMRLVPGGLVGSAPAVTERIRADQAKWIRLLVLSTLVGFVAGILLWFPPLFLLPIIVLLLAPRGERRRAAYWELLRSNVDASFARLDAAVGAQFNEARSDALRQFDATVGRCVSWYDEQVQSRTTANRARADEAARAERGLHSDLASLEQRRNDLHEARAGLLELQRL